MKYTSVLDTVNKDTDLTKPILKPIQIIGPDGTLTTIWVKQD